MNVGVTLQSNQCRRYLEPRTVREVTEISPRGHGDGGTEVIRSGMGIGAQSVLVQNLATEAKSETGALPPEQGRRCCLGKMEISRKLNPH